MSVDDFRDIPEELSRRLAEIANRAVRDIQASVLRERLLREVREHGKPHAIWSGPDITGMRLEVYKALVRGVRLGREDQSVATQNTALRAPRATQTTDPGFDSEATTQRYQRHQDPERPRTMLPPPLPAGVGVADRLKRVLRPK